MSADYDKITGFFEDLKDYLAQLQILENRVDPTPELQLAVTKILDSVLVLCGISVKYIRRRRIGMINIRRALLVLDRCFSSFRLALSIFFSITFECCHS